MRLPKHIYEVDNVINFLQKRQLTSQYKKAKSYILSGVLGSSKLKERKPKNSGVRSFRINKQFRAIGYFDNDDLIITMIDNHQN